MLSTSTSCGGTERIYRRHTTYQLARSAGLVRNCRSIYRTHQGRRVRICVCPKIFHHGDGCPCSKNVEQSLRTYNRCLGGVSRIVANETFSEVSDMLKDLRTIESHGHFWSEKLERLLILFSKESRVVTSVMNISLDDSVPRHIH